MLSRHIERLRRRFGAVDTILAVQERVGVVGGGPLASAVAMAAFLSLFPLLLVGVAVVGWLSAGNLDFAHDVVERLGLKGTAADTVLDAVETAEDSRRTATVVGLVGVVWSGLGVVASVESCVNAVWQVRGRGIRAKLRQVLWLVGAGALLLGSLSIGPSVNLLPGPAAVGGVLVGFVVDTMLFAWTFTTLVNAPVSWREHLPGSVLGGVGLGVLKLVGGVVVPRMVADSSALYGSIGVVFALLAWMLLGARLLVYAAAYNVVRYERSYGTVTVDIEVPRMDGQIPLEATRGGAVIEPAAAEEP